MRQLDLKIYFVRHGKTKWNLESRYQGAGGNSELLPESYVQMKQLGEYLKDIHFVHAYSSPIKRARVTAFHVIGYLKSKPSLTLWNRLEEFHLGKMEGQKFVDVQHQFPVSFDNFRNHPDKYNNKFIGGENFLDVINRMTPAIQQIVHAHDDNDNVLVFSHGAALNALINSLLHVPLADLRRRGGLSNTSTTILETHDNGASFKLLTWNNTDYLDKRMDKTDII